MALSGAEAGLFVVVPDAEGGREYYTLVYRDGSGVKSEKVRLHLLSNTCTVAEVEVLDKTCPRSLSAVREEVQLIV